MALKNNHIINGNFKQLDTVLTNASQFPQITEVMEAVDRIQDSMQGEQSHDHKGSSLLPKNTKRNRKKKRL